MTSRAGSTSAGSGRRGANDQAYDVEAREKLRRLSEELTGIRSGRRRGPEAGS